MADLDKDGNDDLVMSSPGFYSSSGKKTGRVFILFGKYIFDFNLFTIIIAYVRRSGKSADLSQIEYFKINIVPKSTFHYDHDVPYEKNPARFGVFIIIFFGISEHKIFLQS